MEDSPHNSDRLGLGGWVRRVRVRRLRSGGRRELGSGAVFPLGF